MLYPIIEETPTGRWRYQLFLIADDRHMGYSQHDYATADEARAQAIAFIELATPNAR